MSRFNTKSTGTKTTNLAGGEAYAQSPELALVSLLLTSFAKDEFYKSSNSSLLDLNTLVEACDKLFVAKAAVFARTKFGMRSITHAVASELAKYIRGEQWAKNFYSSVVHRPDDITEILSYHFANKQTESNAMKKGLAKAFDKFDKYQLAKYKGEGKGLKLIDAVNLLHPVPTEKNREALKELVEGKLRSFDTWESELTKAGQAATSEEEKGELKKEAWVNLIQSRKIGYFALLRNLRNIKEQSHDILKEALELLVDATLIKKSLVLPFRYLTAIEQFDTDSNARDIVVALNKAMDISCSNIPVFSGRSLVVCDYSGSMGDGYSSYKYKGSLFGAAFARANNADFMIFGDSAEYVGYNPGDSVLTITKHFTNQNNGGYYQNKSGIQVGHGTNFSSIFHKADKAYDRVIIFSDMQGWIGGYTPVREFNSYKSRMGANPVIYSFDLTGYGTMQFPENNVYALAGFSEKVFDIMKLLEQDRNSMISEINKVEF